MRIVDLEGKLNTAASNREFSLLKEQIAADEQANSVLSDEILEALEQLDLMQDQVENKPKQNWRSSDRNRPRGSSKSKPR